MKINISLVILLLISVSCVEPPLQFVKEGVQTREAILFLEQLEGTKWSQELFSDHIKKLNSSVAVDFDWATYWNEVREKQLYKKLDKSQLESVLQLSGLSCESSDWSAFANLLLQLAKINKNNLYFRYYLTGSNKTCPTFLPDEILEEVINFLAKKRDETEVDLFTEQRAKEQASSKDKNDLTKYPYTEELYGVLEDEWNAKKQGRAWGDILDVVNRLFWSDVRWMFYHTGNFDSIKTTLEMELNVYHSITDLDQDVLLMFPDKEMKNIMDLVGYEEYFKEKGLMEWGSVWRQIANQYSSKPDNDNNTLLLSFYKYSCEKEELDYYMQLLRKWDVVDQYRTVVERECEQIIRITQQITQYIDTAGLPADGAFPLSIEELGDMLKATKGNRSIDDLIRLLNFYDRFKINYSISVWQTLLTDQFSMENWLYFMRVLRGNYDKSIIRRVMDMHQYIYQGYIPFLSMDVFSILTREDVLLSSLVKEYNYSEAQLESPDFIDQFWFIVNENASQILSAKARWNNLLEYGSHFCNQIYLNKMVSFFNDNNQERLLLDNFPFNNCPNYFMDTHFKEDFVNSVVTKIRQGENQDPELYWDLVRSFSLYTSANSIEDLQNTAIFKMNEVEWERVFNITIATLREPAYKYHSAFLKRAMDLIGTVYKTAVDSAICQQVLSSPDSHKTISEYEPEFVMYLLNQIQWDNSNSYCSDLDEERLNMLMFIIANYLFSSVEDHLGTTDYVLSIWSQAVRAVNIMEKVYSSSTPWGSMLGSYFISKPDLVNGKIGHRAFQYYFSYMILSYLSDKTSLLSAMEILKKRIWEQSDSNTYHSSYEEILEDSVEDYPSLVDEIEALKKNFTFD